MRGMIVPSSAMLFLCVFFIHVLISRLYRPRSEDKLVFRLYVFFPLFLFIVGFLFNFFGIIPRAEATLVYFLYFVLSSSWVASYPAIYSSCPTLIISFVIRKKKTGVKREDLKELLDLKKNSHDRVEDAVKEKLVFRKGDHIQLTPFGWLLGAFFEYYRRLLGLKSDTV